MRMTTVSLGFTVVVLFSGAAAAQGLGEVGPCTSDSPGPSEVYVYEYAETPSWIGKCAALGPGAYPYLGYIQDDSHYWGINSMKVGSEVRIRLFTGESWTGYFEWFGPGDYYYMPLDWWNGVTDSMRVEWNARSPTCNDLGDGEFAVYANPGFTGDCVVLRYGFDYPTPFSFGMADNSISSFIPGRWAPFPNGCGPGEDATWHLYLWKDPNMGVGEGTGADSGSGPVFNIDPEYDNQISHISTGGICF
jgi:hypothetical protein